MATEKYFCFDEQGELKRIKGRLVRFLDNEAPTGSDKSAIRTSLEVSPDAEGLVQADVGTSPNEIPVNGMLGDLAYQSSEAVSVAELEVTDKITGNLGIGVSPDKPLHVGGSGEQTLRLERTSDGLADGSVVGSIEFEANDTSTNGSGVVSKIQSESLNATGNLFGLSFHTGHGGSLNENMVLDNDGRLGLGGQSTPGNFNAAADDLCIGDSSGNRGITVSSGDASTGNLFFGDATSGSIARGAVSYDHSTNALSLTTSASTAVTIDSSQRVGIGNTSPSNKLTVEPADNDGILIDSNNDARTGYLYFGDATSKTAGAVSYDHYSDSLRFNTAGTQRWTINSTGNLVAGSGLGIDFGATSDGSGTMSSELLDDYEEGQFSPMFGVTSGSFTTMTMDVIKARYVKIGHLVNFYCYIRTDDVDTTGTGGHLTVGGLPYANAGSDSYVPINVGFANFWTNAPAGGYVYTGADYIILAKRLTSITGALTGMAATADLTSGTTANQNQLMISGSYYSF